MRSSLLPPPGACKISPRSWIPGEVIVNLWEMHRHISLHSHLNHKIKKLAISDWTFVCDFVCLSVFVLSVSRCPAAADFPAVQISQSGGALTGGQWTQTVSLCVIVRYIGRQCKQTLPSTRLTQRCIWANSRLSTSLVMLLSDPKFKFKAACTGCLNLCINFKKIFLE